MDYLLKKYCPRIEFDSYEDFYENFRIDVPEAFNFGFDVVDEWARVEPEKRALVWCDDHGGERTFTFTDLSRLSNQAANAFRKLGMRRRAVQAGRHHHPRVAAADEEGHRLSRRKRPGEDDGVRERRLRVRADRAGAA